MEYIFTNNWFEYQKQVHDFLLNDMNENEMDVLEIGSHEGRSTVYFLEKGEKCIKTVTSVDAYDTTDSTSPVDNKTLENFIHNITATGQSQRLHLIKGYSSEVLSKLVVLDKQYDYILIDGSHLSHHVFNDAVLSFALLKPE
eukprot:Pgem_evm5s555